MPPAFPWKWKDEENFTGGLYTGTKAYRNFALVLVQAAGGSVLNNTYGWKRLTPSKMKPNRAWAQIPINRFDNFNETQSQLPDFTTEDMPMPETNDGTQGSNNLMLLSFFEDETNNAGAEVDGIKTVNNVVVKADSDAWYTIQGIKVAQPTKGVYIHNGKKVVIK